VVLGKAAARFFERSSYAARFKESRQRRERHSESLRALPHLPSAVPSSGRGSPAQLRHLGAVILE
jgi:hypothetical protein